MASPGAAIPEVPEIPVPKQFVRVGGHGCTWDLPRRFPGYFVDTEIKGLLGNATKWVIRTHNSDDPQYLIKYAQKFGERETFTEFFINQLGVTLGFSMAHSGIVRLDGTLAFLSQVFTSTKETLRHGSLVIEDYYKDEKALEKVKRKEEQAFYSADFVVDLLKQFCGDDFNAVFPKFIEMLVFDAVIGSMDRHVQNWGVLETVTKPAHYRFAPIFDSARALLWSMDESQVQMLLADSKALRAHIDRARPCLGPKHIFLRGRHCNHFSFIANLLELYPGPTGEAIQKVPDNVPERSHQLLHRFPFLSEFSNARKQLIVTILRTRVETLKTILEKGGTS
jgi:hypothetical protein